MNYWIHINKQIPNYYSDVFLYLEDEDEITIGMAVEHNGEFEGFKEDINDEFFLNNVTHWQKIIKPEKPEKTVE